MNNIIKTLHFHNKWISLRRRSGDLSYRKVKESFRIKKLKTLSPDGVKLIFNFFNIFY